LPFIPANGNFNAMNAKIDKTGRLVLPKSLRDHYGITPETELELIPSADGLLLRRVAERPSLQQIDGLWVHQGCSTGTTTTAWAEAIDSVRNERADNAWKAG
jgi:bifunctional DNA-binding transcriptional regulator/antitoxin component of YhaV-PrlF toxin-antitoxin module